MLVAAGPIRDRTAEYRAAAPAPSPAPRVGMVWVPGGTFAMGSSQFYPEERPVRQIAVAGFWMDDAPVTNRDFSRFVADTGYVTEAERAAKGETDVWTSVFVRPRGPVPLNDPRNWWRLAPADWRHPRGIKSSISGLSRHPVVQLTFMDMCAYCDWSGTLLPTEAEWEFAARGGLEGAVFPWGNHEPAKKGQRLANTWQGRFPFENTLDDGFEATSPVRSYPPNGFGLYDVSGNVWEMTADRFDKDASAGCCSAVPHEAPRMVIKGGSHLCAPEYCFRYRPAARSGQEANGATSHIGFRTIIRA